MKANALASRLPRHFTSRAGPVAPSCAAPAPHDSDDWIRKTLLARLEREPWWQTATSNVFVERGTVIFQGLAGNSAARQPALQAARQVPGVRGIRDARVPRREWQAMA